MGNRDDAYLFDVLCSMLGARADRRGEVDWECPFCGKPVKPGHRHFSFSERGGYCMVCGEGKGLRYLGKLLLGPRWDDVPGEDWRKVRAPVRQAPRTPRPDRRYKIMDHEPTAILEDYRQSERSHALWFDYAPALTRETILRAGLTAGALPRYSSRCTHIRLMVPLEIRGGSVVGFRARSITCDCGKWLGPGGNPSKFLYNGERISPPGSFHANRPDDPVYFRRQDAGEQLRSRQTLFVVENPVDALLLEQSDWAAVATLGVSNWDDEWTQAILGSDVGRVVVLFDNDAPGNGGGARGRLEWAEKHKGPPPLNGVKLANRLLASGVQARVFDWEHAPIGTDVGDMLRDPKKEE